MLGKWTFILLILVLVAGCGNSKIITDNEPAQMLKGTKVRVIEFWHTYNGEETRILEQELIPAFERQNPDIKVISVRKEVNLSLKNTLVARAYSDRGPDVVRMNMYWVPDFYLNKLLIPLKEFPDFRVVRNTLNRKGMTANDDQHYSLPLERFTNAAIFNKALLKQARYSEPPRTMEEVLDLARQKHYRIGLGTLNTWATLPYIYSLGGSMMDTKFSKAAGYLNSEVTVRAVEKLLLLYKEGLIDRKVVDEAGGGYNWEDVKSGNVLIMGEGSWFYSTWTGAELNRALENTIPVPFPHDKGPSSMITGEDLVIMKGSRQPEAVWTFMKWMTGKEAQLTMSRTGLLPANVEAANSMTVNRDSYIHVFQEAMDYNFLNPSVKNWDEINEVYTHYLRKIFRGEITPKNGLTLAAEEIDRILSASSSE